MSIFSPSDAPCGVFGPQIGEGTVQAVSFARSAALLQGRAPVQSPGGEVLVSWVGIGPYTLDVQPMPAGYSRMVQGILVKVDIMMFGPGTIPVQEGDRCYYRGRQLECTNALLYGDDHGEWEFREVAR